MRPSASPQAGDLFHTEAWFQNLQMSGFPQPPVLHTVPLAPGEPGAPASAQLHLMQPKAGGTLFSCSSYYSCLYGPVAAEAALGELNPLRWREVARAIRQLPGSAVLRLQPLDASAHWLAALEQGLQASGYWTDRYFCFGNWFQRIGPGGFDAYWAARPSALRHSVERGRKRLDKAGEWHIGITSGGDPQGLEIALAAYESVYAQSWKQPEPCPDFMPGLVRTAAREGWLRLGVLWLDGRPLAAQVWLIYGGKANIYKLAFVAGQEKLSAGSVLTAALMEHVLNVDQVQEVDYLSGDDAYKADWMAERRERVGLVAFDLRRWGGVASAVRHTLGQRWRRFRSPKRRESATPATDSRSVPPT